MFKRRLILFSLAAILFALVLYQQTMMPPNAQAQRRSVQHFGRLEFSPKKFEPQQVVSPRAPIINPKHVSADEGNKTLQPNELVLGVVIDEQARAYPINMLTGPDREIFNDRLGTQDIAATW